MMSPVVLFTIISMAFGRYASSLEHQIMKRNMGSVGYAAMPQDSFVEYKRSGFTNMADLSLGNLFPQQE
ncbi:Oidioi.mRNA.OKI2018_I69.PAR.g9829.t1.cds [Oikopleura dioica]|uniref:Oidioi.mRNA.OKI2018_I69.PAR.g9829.t1.cds n=1 Tax=Oikopleura dioica TaxID=34765 RepID=A0ABN7RRY3_OIKDI|nr:Oidioi.mRNA.OKI2018_I69.PAR.g9829.t1.cds [Oikopleura dioica]